MGDLSLSDAEIDLISEIDLDPSQSTGHQESKLESRRRGRPPGTFGGRIWRKTQKDLAQQQEALKPKPGDIEFARECRSKAAQKRREAKQEAVSSSSGLVLPKESSADDLVPYLPPNVLAPSSAKPLHVDMQNSFLKACSKNVGCDDQLTEQHLQGSMDSLSYTAFEKLSGDNNAGRRILSLPQQCSNLQPYFGVDFYSSCLVDVSSRKRMMRMLGSRWWAAWDLGTMKHQQRLG